ncbi:glycoside hydrolase family 3 N-terminal domain-containing protein [Caulobacter endophyticus]|uniref:glycoside hydrolase family 3 N-terminal domain-containing protein n=1 Tax=Caulobacter endophyticus TaxID=2172652 RepID=UPI00240F79DF|nr:glycoside hydrolase family 3 N-terminal domain-containing protein [Caulobacter endophyticus]MDG2529440.1 glycoside hydrolase family 3 N-terminal domain-containing protein [Caulobacter endophyticus]
MTTTLTRRTLGVSLAALGAAMAPAVRAAPKPADGKALYKDPAQPVDARVKDLLSRMTLEEKAAQLIGIWLTKAAIQTPTGDFSPETATKNFPNGLGQISRPTDRRGLKPTTEVNAAAGAEDGSVGRNAPQTAKYVNAAQKWAMESTRLGIPMLMHDEALHGYVARDATSFPQSIALASTFDPELVEQVFSVAAKEMRARGSNIALAPVVDVARDPRWGRIEETYGEDPHVCAEMGLAAIRGFQGKTLPLAPDKVFVTLKHMTGHGQPENGTNVGPAQIAERTLRENFFPPFERAVKELPVRSVMPSYNEIDGVPSHANRWLLTDILRGEWGFQGATMSDYFAIKEIITRHKLTDQLADTAVMAINAGVDVELPDGEAYVLLPQLVRSGRIPEAAVDAAVARVLKIKFEGGLFENPYADEKAADAKTATPQAVALAREAARKAVVLLKNDKGLLPLDGRKIKRLALLGTHAKDTPIGGYSDEPRHVVSVLEGLTAEAKAQGFALDYAEAVRITEKRVWAADEVKLVDPAVNARLIAEAVEVAKKADVVVMVLGDNEQTSREAWADNHLGDRDSLDLVGQQNDLARAIFALGKPTVVLLLNGRPLSVNLLAEKADALVEGWYLGQETGNAAADVLFGRANPGGKLPVSIARDVGQLPIYYNRKPTARRGYLFDRATSPLYPFGFGLSYTRFEIAAPRLSKARIGQGESTTVSVEVTNTGKVAGDEVVQLYVHDEAASVTRPVLELKHFKRVTLAPGEKKTVSFEVKPSDLWMWNLAMKRVVEPGDFSILVGPNSVDLKSAKLTVA